MTREDLIKAIYDNAEIWSCPNSDCGDKSAEEYRINDCIRCAEKLLSEYDKQIRAEVIDECITTLKDSYPLVDDNDILYGFGCAIHRLEQLKEQK